MAIKRLFIAAPVDSSPELTEITNAIKKQLPGAKISWVIPENLHITLQFLGNCDEIYIEQISARLGEICSTFSKSTGELRGIDYFEQQHEPKVLFAKLNRLPELDEMATLLQNTMKFPGLESEIRRFQPHLTLARIKLIKNIEPFQIIVNQYINNYIQKIAFEKIVLFESHLFTTGPVYEKRSIFTLKDKTE